MAAWGNYLFNLSVGGELHLAQTLMVSGNFFPLLGVPPAQGRLLTAADDQRGCSVPNAVLSDAFWQRRYGGQPGAIGQTLTLEGHTFEIVGVTPPRFFGLEVGRNFDVAIPLCAEPLRAGVRLSDRQAMGLVAGRGGPPQTGVDHGARIRTLAGSLRRYF